MFRKITSNTAFSASIRQEIYKHWEVYFTIIESKCTRILNRYPKTIFAFMIISILLSIGYFFFIPPKKIPETSPPHPIMGSIQTGINGLISTASTINELLELNSLIESMALKDSLNKQDSLLLIEILDKMQIIEKSLDINNRQTIIHDK